MMVSTFRKRNRPERKQTDLCARSLPSKPETININKHKLISPLRNSPTMRKT